MIPSFHYNCIFFIDLLIIAFEISGRHLLGLGVGLHLKIGYWCWLQIIFWHSFHCCSVTKLCLALWDLRDCSRPGFPVLHHLPEFAENHVHWVNDAIQPSYPLLSPSPPALNLSQYQGLFQCVWKHSFHMWPHLILTTTLQGKCDSPFTDGETEAQKAKSSSPAHMANCW